MYVEKFSAGKPEKNHEDNEDTTLLFWVLAAKACRGVAELLVDPVFHG